MPSFDVAAVRSWGEALRISLAHYNPLDDVDRFNRALASLVETHAAGSPALYPSGRPR